MKFDFWKDIMFQSYYFKIAGGIEMKLDGKNKHKS